MARRIYIVGGIDDDHDRQSLIEKLKAKFPNADINWHWIKAVPADGWRPPAQFLAKMFSELAKVKPPDDARVILLKRTNRETKNLVTRQCEDPLIPEYFATGDDLIAWLVSPEAGLVPGLPWCAEVRIATFFSILAKLLKNKSWNKDVHGHAWTREADLLGQSPVNTPERPEIRAEAVNMLAKLAGTILLTKGGNQGKTKKEWSINTGVLPEIKRAFLDQALTPLRKTASLAAVLTYLESGQGQVYRLDEVIQVERVRQVCREKDRGDKPKKS